MEELFEGGLQWSLGARLPDGVAGLRMVVGVLIDDPLSLSSLLRMGSLAKRGDKPSE